MTFGEKDLRWIMGNSTLLKALRSAAGPVNALSLATIGGMDVNAVANHLGDLHEKGYPILSHENGFQLTAPCDFLYPWEFDGREERVYYFPEIDSTMTAARTLARSGCPAFTVVVAECQTLGRGRLKRTWHSMEGGLYFTLVLRPALRPEDSGQINFLASVTLATVLREYCGIDAGVKWPNDILVGNRKIAGMLSEQETDGAQVHYVNIGIGLNVNNDPSPVEPSAVSLKELVGKPVLRAPLLNLFLDELERNLEKMSWEETLWAWRKMTVTLNRRVKIATARETVEGIAKDIDGTGALILQLADGSQKKIVYGDCFIRPE
jgi:BirA family transcriptional regulator, biotin operon repressor / biotin---[acetyl-CoA-carboxylase] ligase